MDEFCADDKSSYQSGILSLLQPDGESGCGALGAWAWGVIRMVGFLQNQPEIGGSKICLGGFSRTGKVAL